MALEALQRDDQDRRCLEDLDLLDCLLVCLTLAAVPFVLPRQLLGPIEQSEAVVNRDLVGIELHVVRA